MLLLDDDDQLPTSPTDSEAILADSLGSSGLLKVDAAIRNATRARWSKVARVLYDAMTTGGFSPHDEAQVHLHTRRVIGLVKIGTLETQGNLLRPRFSEIRLPAGNE
jgi:hypothetical protein